MFVSFSTVKCHTLFVHLTRTMVSVCIRDQASVHSRPLQVIGLIQIIILFISTIVILFWFYFYSKTIKITDIVCHINAEPKAMHLSLFRSGYAWGKHFNFKCFKSNRVESFPFDLHSGARRPERVRFISNYI